MMWWSTLKQVVVKLGGTPALSSPPSWLPFMSGPRRSLRTNMADAETHGCPFIRSWRRRGTTWADVDISRTDYRSEHACADARRAREEQ